MLAVYCGMNSANCNVPLFTANLDALNYIST